MKIEYKDIYFLSAVKQAMMELLEEQALLHKNIPAGPRL